MGGSLAFDFNSIKVEAFDKVLKLEQKLTYLPLRKPKKTEFFRVREGWTIDIHILQAQVNGSITPETYVVIPELCSELAQKGLLKPVRVFCCIAWGSGIMFLSDVGLTDGDGKTNQYNVSRMQHYKVAMKKWVQIQANTELGAYTIVEAVSPLPEPVYPQYPADMNEALNLCFAKNIIKDRDHPILKQFRGEL